MGVSYAEKNVARKEDRNESRGPDNRALRKALLRATLLWLQKYPFATNLVVGQTFVSVFNLRTRCPRSQLYFFRNVGARRDAAPRFRLSNSGN